MVEMLHLILLQLYFLLRQLHLKVFILNHFRIENPLIIVLIDQDYLWFQCHKYVLSNLQMKQRISDVIHYSNQNQLDEDIFFLLTKKVPRISFKILWKFLEEKQFHLLYFCNIMPNSNILGIASI